MQNPLKMTRNPLPDLSKMNFKFALGGRREKGRKAAEADESVKADLEAPIPFSEWPLRPFLRKARLLHMMLCYMYVILCYVMFRGLAFGLLDTV